MSRERKPQEQIFDTTETLTEEKQSGNDSNQQSNTTATNSSALCLNSNIRTLFHTQCIDGKLIIPELNTKSTSICVISNGQEYREGSCELKIGDTVYVVSKKYKHCTFSHFKIISLSPKDNCILVFRTRVRNKQKLKLPREDYSAFLRDFRRRHDL